MFPITFPQGFRLATKVKCIGQFWRIQCRVRAILIIGIRACRAMVFPAATPRVELLQETAPLCQPVHGNLAPQSKIFLPVIEIIAAIVKL